VSVVFSGDVGQYDSPVLRDPNSEPVLMGFFCRIARRQLGKRLGVASESEQLRTLLRRAREYGRAGEELVERVAEDLGMDPTELGK